MTALRRVLALTAVVLATLAGGYLALVSFSETRTLSVGTVRLSVSPGHRGALDIYAPLVDWGARFEAIASRRGCAPSCARSTARSSRGWRRVAGSTSRRCAARRATPSPPSCAR